MAPLNKSLGITNARIAMTIPKNHSPVPNRRWAVWLGRLLLIPLTAASGGMVFGLYRHVATGQLSTVAKSYGATSRTINFAETPVWFLAFFVLHAAITALVIVVTVVVGRLVFKRRLQR